MPTPRYNICPTQAITTVVAHEDGRQPHDPGRAGPRPTVSTQAEHIGSEDRGDDDRQRDRVAEVVGNQVPPERVVEHVGEDEADPESGE